MDLGKYVKDYEAAIEQQKQEAAALKEHARIARLHNAEVIEKFLQEVVNPVLQVAVDQLRETICQSEIVWQRRGDGMFPTTPAKDFALEIKLQVKKSPQRNVGQSSLAYVGSFDDQKVTQVMQIEGSNRHPFDCEVYELGDITKRFIEQQLERFVKEVFTLRK